MAAKTNKTKTIGFQLKRITTDQFAVIQESYDNTKTEIGLSIHLKFGLDHEHRFIGSSVLVQFEQDHKAFIVVEITNHYLIEKITWEEFSKEIKFVIPKGFATHLVVLTIGTLRGVLHSKTENTEFNKFILPTINVTELVKNDIELAVELR